MSVWPLRNTSPNLRSGVLSLPGSGYEQIAKILHAYALCGDNPIALDDVATKAAMNPSVVSRNNGFFVTLGLLSGGKSKTLTHAGKELAVALGHDLAEDAALAWKRAITAAPAARPVLDMLRVQRTVPVEALPARIATATALGQPDSPSTRTGTNTLIEIFRRAALIEEADRKVSLVQEKVAPTSGSTVDTRSLAPAAEPTKEAPAGVLSALLPSSISTAAAPASPTNEGVMIPIHVNIELHLPPSAEQAVYDALFKSIREHLLSR